MTLPQAPVLPAKAHLLLLPDEILLEIISYLPYPSLAFLRKAHPHFDHIFVSRHLLPEPVETVLPPVRVYGPLPGTPRGISTPIPRMGRYQLTYGDLPGVRDVLAGAGAEEWVEDDDDTE